MEMEVSCNLLYKSNMKQATVINSIPAFALYGEGLDERFPDGLHIETIHARSTIHDWRIKTHRHYDLHQFFWISSGGGTAEIEGQNEKLLPDTAVVVPPLTIHGFSFEHDTSGFVVSIPTGTLDRVLGEDISLRTSLERPSIIIVPPALAASTKKMQAEMQAALDEFLNSAAGRSAALFAHAALISLSFARLSIETHALKSSANDVQATLVRRFLQLIETHFRAQLPLEHYARELGVSAPHLSRVCREVLNCSALTLLHNRLLLEARRNLVYTSMTISQIAFALGFSDPAYFTRFFTSRIGCSPSVYRSGVLTLSP
jgi:AraC family transcriptional regulator, transcriptional activator of pobA